MTDTDAKYRARLNEYLDAERALFEAHTGITNLGNGPEPTLVLPGEYADLLANYQAAKIAFAKAAEAAGHPIPYGFLADTEQPAAH